VKRGYASLIHKNILSISDMSDNMNGVGNGKASEVNEKIRKCLAQLGYGEMTLRPLPSGKNGSRPAKGPKPNKSQRLSYTPTSGQILVKRLLVKQLLLINTQNQMLEKQKETIENQRLSINDLTEKNQKASIILFSVVHPFV